MIYILTILFTLTDVTCAPMSHVGSAIFCNRKGMNECWSDDELAILRARQVFEQAMPPSVTPEKVNGRYIREMLNYFRQALSNVGKNTDLHSKALLKTALADAIGAHLTKDILPAARFSYYAGYVPYRKVREAHDFLEQIKLFLNTQGVGWSRPDIIPPWTNISVLKVYIGHGKLLNPCSGLVIKRDTNACIHFPRPKEDNNIDPSAIALPFKSGGLVSIVSPESENILLKYYTTAARCILRSSSESCRHDDFLNFNNELWHWMKRSVAPHLGDEKLYSAYGGILRIAAAVQSYGKGLSRRNLFEDEEQGFTNWHPWKTISETYMYVDSEWTPTLYIMMISLAAAVVCLSQICYSIIFGKGNGCHCAGEAEPRYPDCESINQQVETVYNAVLPLHRSSIYSESTRLKHARTGVKTSLRSIQTQRVYDLHENTEKIMAVIMSDEDTSEVESESLQSSNRLEHKVTKSYDTVPPARDGSPPEIETSMSQLKIDKKANAKRSPAYSTSTNSHSAITYCNERRDTGSAWSGTSTSEQSITSGSFKSRCRKSKNSRDLAWARRVASKASQAKSATSGTELDVNSFITPPSKHLS